jgi:hypothetical protein
VTRIKGKSPTAAKASRFAGLLCWLLLCAVPARAQDSGLSLDTGGLLFGDLYYLPSHHLENGDGAVGLVLRRGYLTFDADFSPSVFGRLRFELNQSGEFETYDFEADFKDLYLGWKLGEHRLLAGLAPTPTFDLIEKRWGLRYLMRTPLDLQGLPSRETGLSLRGPLNASGSLAYRVMLGSRYEFGAESSENPRYMAALNWRPAPGWDIDLYLDHEKRETTNDLSTIQLFISRQRENLRWGALYSNVDIERENPEQLVSFYIVGDLDDRRSLVGRIDRIFEPSPRGDNISYIPFDPTAPATMYLGAYEYRLRENLTITPNVIVIDYDRDDRGVQPETDVFLRLTAYFRF